MADTSRLGRYEIRREIARSNDIVYEAVDTLIGRRVALKELSLPPNLVGQAKRERVERFYREARAVGALSHRNIVTIFEVGEDHGRHFIAMEFLEGQTIRQLLDTGGALSVPQAKEYLLQVLDALAFAHSNGVIHRDIKPDNLYLLPDGTVKITDFGIARIMDEPSLTGEGQVFGTPSYMSLEQITGKPMDERTDLYSVGVVAYEMLSGHKPFVGENLVALTYQILSVEPQPPRGLSPDLSAVILKAMAKDPAARYQTAQQMVADLRADPLAAGQITSVGPSVSGSTTSGWSVAGLPHLQLPDPVATGNPPIPSAHPTQMPGMAFPRQRFQLSEGTRQFLLAMAGGLLLGMLVVVAALGVRRAYQSYSQNIRERGSLSVYAEGAKAYNEKRYEQAAQRFATVVQRARGTPLASKAVYGMVQSYIQLGNAQMGRDLQLARAYYQRAIQANPKNPEPYMRLGDVLERLNHFDAAMSTWQRVIDLDGFGSLATEARRQQSIAAYNRGADEYNVGNHEAARRYWQRAINADPNSAIARRAEEMLRRITPSAYPTY